MCPIKSRVSMRKLTILAVPLNAVGHVNACSGALEQVLARGHRVIFVIESAFQHKLKLLGYEEFCYTLIKRNCDNPGELLAKRLFDGGLIGDLTADEKLLRALEIFHGDDNYEELRQFDHATKTAIDLHQPDLIVYDGSFSLLPSVYYSGIPWVKLISTAPLGQIFDTEEVPPGFSGLPCSKNARFEYHRFNKMRKEFHNSAKYSQLISELGYKPFPGNLLYPETQVLTLYAYPEEINYQYILKLNWFNLEVFQKGQTQLGNLEKVVPRDFLELGTREFSGKWIYLSLGSMGAIDVHLMKRVVAILAQTPHKYIVSKGPRHSEFDLPGNMCGGRYVCQERILTLVDLVITHGGNNTVTETFAQGLPMIVLPLLTDQFDNSQRLHETGYGIRLDPYNFTLDEINCALDKLLFDVKLNAKLKRASKRILTGQRHSKLAEEIEKLFFI